MLRGIIPDGRHLFIAWMSNWQYAGVVPSMTWRGGMTLPRELALQKDADGRPIITSRIVKEVDAIAGEWKTISASDNTDRKSTRLNSSHTLASRMPSSA